MLICSLLIMVFPSSSACFQITFQTQIYLDLNEDPYDPSIINGALMMHWLAFLIIVSVCQYFWFKIKLGMNWI